MVHQGQRYADVSETDDGREMMQRHPQTRFLTDLDAQGLVVEMNVAFGT